MKNIDSFRYYKNIKEKIHIMSFSREIVLRDISTGGISFFTPHYEAGDILKITITIPQILQIFNEKIEVISIPTSKEPFYRAKFINPTEEFIYTFKEFMEENNDKN